MTWYTRYKWRLLATAGLVAIGALLSGWLQWSLAVTNEVHHAVCVPQQSCFDDCVIDWLQWATGKCPAGQACVAFHTHFGDHTQFKACVASNDPGLGCNTGNVLPPPPVVATCSGFFHFCACRDLVEGDCENDTPPPPFPCLCIGWPDGPGTYQANNNCS